MLKKIISVLCLCLICFAGTVLADAPNPGGRRHRPWEDQPPFVVEKVMFLGDGNPEQLGAEIFFKTPVPADVSFCLCERKGGHIGPQLSFRKVPFEGGQGSFVVPLPAPEEGTDRRELWLNVYYTSSKCLTPFGLKDYGRLYNSNAVNIRLVIELKDGACEARTE